MPPPDQPAGPAGGTVDPLAPSTPPTRMSPDALRDQIAQQNQQNKDAVAKKEDDLQKKIDAQRKQLWKRVYANSIGPGSLVVFNYLYWKHDAQPMVLVSGTYPRTKTIAGLNMHYFTYKYAKSILNMFGGKAGFGYRNISGNSYVASAFRSYKMAGVRNVRALDMNILKDILNKVRSYNQADQERIRNEVRSQLNQQVNQSADDLASEYQSMVVPKPYGDYGLNKQQPDGRFNPTDIDPLEP